MKTKAYTYGIIAAALFGASAPFSKYLLGNIAPIQLAGLLYLGSGLSLFGVKLIQSMLHLNQNAAKLEKSDLPWLFGSIISGGILAPISLMIGLSLTPAATASILLNFEAASTAVLAGLLFHEQIGKRSLSRSCS